MYDPKTLVKFSEETCKSAEDLLCEIEKYNDSEDLSQNIIESMDVKSLYSLIETDFAVVARNALI